MNTDQPEKLDLLSRNVIDDKLQELLRLFPEIRTEGNKLDFDRLKLALGETVDVGKERYGMNWPGKADCFKAIQTPTLATLRPCPEESVNFDTTENLIVEGDNLEVLKLLQKSYLAKIKMIYIDPPYNRGNDLIYPDNYSESLQTYLEYTGQVDAGGKKFSTNTEADGRFHSRWLNMMYPRLYLARNLLREDGVIFISIDENEVDNLRKICNEVFGDENHIEDLVWAQNTTHSQSPLYSTNHEYVIVYARNALALQGQSGVFREPKPGFHEITALAQNLSANFLSIKGIEQEIAVLMQKHKEDYEAELAQAGLILDEDAERQDPWRGIYAYKNVEYRGDKGDLVSEENAQKLNARIVIWQSSDASAPAAKQASSIKDSASPNFRFYRPKHPKTGKACPHPKTGWRWPQSWPDDSRDSFHKFEKEHRIVWGVDETTVPRFKRFLHEVETNVAKSFFYDYTDGEKQLAALFGEAAIFPNPKPTTLVTRFLMQVCNKGEIVLDFFCGSGTTAQSVLELNKEDGGNRRFVLVQLPEPLDPDDKDQKAASDFCDKIGKPRKITEITKERIRRVIQRLDRDAKGKRPGLFDGVQDCGFRVFELAESNFNSWNAQVSHESMALEQQLELHVNHIRESRADQDILYEILLKSGYPLTTPVEMVTLADKTVYSVASGQLLICLERGLTLDLIRAMAEQNPERVVCLDEGFAGNDQLKTNAAHIFEPTDRREAKSDARRFRTV
jgi:adenine-specific DNA-methyltransferase